MLQYQVIVMLQYQVTHMLQYQVIVHCCVSNITNIKLWMDESSQCCINLASNLKKNKKWIYSSVLMYVI